MTRFEELEEVTAEVKLKQLMWDSRNEWETSYNEWMTVRERKRERERERGRERSEGRGTKPERRKEKRERGERGEVKMEVLSVTREGKRSHYALPLQTPFDELVPDTVNTQVIKFAKSIYQLEKGLPPNAIVPTLKAKVEDMKDKMPVIQDLRNPSLKTRHWEQIEEILEHKFDPDEKKTLKLLQELNAFDYAEALQEVSGQASSEASLEGILKKVVNLHVLTCTCT